MAYPGHPYGTGTKGNYGELFDIILCTQHDTVVLPSILINYQLTHAYLGTKLSPHAQSHYFNTQLWYQVIHTHTTCTLGPTIVTSFKRDPFSASL